MKPALRSGLLPLWRDRDTVQLGINPRRAIAISGVNGAVEVLSLLDGSRDRAQVIGEAGRLGIPDATAERILTLLASAGALIDFPAGAVASIPPELRRELLPEAACSSLAGQDGDGGMRALAKRAATTVAVCGTGRIAETIAELLTCSGLAVALWHSPPSADGAPPDLGVLTGRQAFGQVDAFQRRGVPHLAVSADEAIGIVGPLVLPGVTACLRCLDLTRADRDPAWPLILAQATSRTADPPACGASLATAVAAQAAAQLTALVDTAALAAATANGTLELVLPDWQWRRRTWPPHPACLCGAAG